ncbi:ABC transporter substrate-binding protein [Pseudidiomarina sediminum]|uniref:ABC transporter substrate-binding protein n=1 Tax=Pseudidiomarina sediminum TaxID=431675 RepID=A0A432Z321_9GAMM|nr:transporter substrate-binding domain-containing protein [Pseudidiomarina sediminum]MBY6064606.1 transporter substrate-binding domain-containing protein [Pseudidiomarina sediminum]RUO72286.1 ABC transporter substrate-binding protein [Pseudidiomarina sediminum]
MFHWVSKALVWVLVLSVSLPSFAQSTPSADASAETPLKVAVRISPPFVTQDAAGNYEGLTIALWEHIAATNGYNYTYVDVALDELINGVASRDYDVGLGAVSVTAERERAIDFTLPFYNAGLGIAVPASQEASWWTLLKAFVSLEFLTVLLALVSILLLAGWLVWLAERRRNPEEFSQTSMRGIGAGFWWAAVTMTTVGYGDKSPRTTAGRVVGLVWMFTSVIIISSFTASITSALTVNKLASKVQNKDDLASVRVASVPSSYSAYWLDREHIGYQQYPTLNAALTAVSEGKADAVVYDGPLVKYQLRKYFSGLSVLPENFAPQDYALVLPERAERREAINRALLQYVRSAEWRQMVNSYLGDNL